MPLQARSTSPKLLGETQNRVAVSELPPSFGRQTSAMKRDWPNTCRRCGTPSTNLNRLGICLGCVMARRAEKLLRRMSHAKRAVPNLSPRIPGPAGEAPVHRAVLPLSRPVPLVRPATYAEYNAEYKAKRAKSAERQYQRRMLERKGKGQKGLKRRPAPARWLRKHRPTRLRTRVDREATAKMQFLHRDSYIHLDGREFLFGADKSKRHDEIRDRVGGFCQLACSTVRRVANYVWATGEWHHDPPKSKGGDDSLQGGKWACRPCHRAAHNREPKFYQKESSNG